MRDIAHKPTTLREATATSQLVAAPETILKIQEGALPKGDALSVAKVAAIQAAKNTAQIIPYCHPVPVESVQVSFDFSETSVACTVSVKAIYRTGVEMEALTAAAVAALTLYDMAKMVDDTLVLGETRLLEKRGGKSDFCDRWVEKLQAAVLVISDSVSTGNKSDRSGRRIVERLAEEGLHTTRYEVVADEPAEIAEKIMGYADNPAIQLVITTGGTGVGPRDITPQTIRPLLETELPGLVEAVRTYGQARTPYAMLSRSMAGIRNGTLIVCLPGSTGGVDDALHALFPAVFHTFKILRGGNHASLERKSYATSAAATKK